MESYSVEQRVQIIKFYCTFQNRATHIINNLQSYNTKKPTQNRHRLKRAKCGRVQNGAASSRHFKIAGLRRFLSPTFTAMIRYGA